MRRWRTWTPAPRRLIFVDETGCNLNMTRRYGRTPKGVRVVDKSVPRNTPSNRSPVGAMSREGILPSMEIEGAIDGDAFFVFLKSFLGPHLHASDVVLMDNLSTHKSARMAAAVARHGAEIIFLPRYSPDFNPIEGAWSKLKAYLRKVAARTPKALGPRADTRTGAHPCRRRPWLVQARGRSNYLILTSN